MLLEVLGQNRVKCITCPLRAATCGMGPCACTVDGVDIIHHTEADYCPYPSAPRYGDGVRPGGWDALPKAGESEAVPVQQPVPRDAWPLAVRVLASRGRDGERGVGDTAKRLLHRMGADGLSRLYEKVTGRDCGCGDRQERMNLMFPYTDAK